MQDEIILLKEKLDYLNDGNRRLHNLYDRRGEQIKNLQTQLDTYENQNGALFGAQSNNQICQRKVEGLSQTLFESPENVNFKHYMQRCHFGD